MLTNEEICVLHRSTSVVNLVNSRRGRLAGCVTWVEKTEYTGIVPHCHPRLSYRNKEKHC